MRNTEPPNRHAIVAAITVAMVGVAIVVSARTAGNRVAAESEAGRSP
jgi:hypothetical protein